MNTKIGAAVLGLALVPVAAFAQASPAPGPDGPGRGPALTDAQRSQLRETMEKSRQQMEQLHQQARAQMLAALSPAHRAALAQIAGNLATTAAPDFRAAAQQVDALLTPSEKQNVLAAETTFRAQFKSVRDQQRQAFLAALTPDQRAQMESRRAHFADEHRDRDGKGPGSRTPDAGMLLLGPAVPHGAFGFGGMRGHDGPGAG